MAPLDRSPHRLRRRWNCGGVRHACQHRLGTLQSIVASWKENVCTLAVQKNVFFIRRIIFNMFYSRYANVFENDGREMREFQQLSSMYRWLSRISITAILYIETSRFVIIKSRLNPPLFLKKEAWSLTYLFQ